MASKSIMQKAKYFIEYSRVRKRHKRVKSRAKVLNFWIDMEQQKLLIDYSYPDVSPAIYETEMFLDDFGTWAEKNDLVKSKRQWVEYEYMGLAHEADGYYEDVLMFNDFYMNTSKSEVQAFFNEFFS